MKAKNKSNRKSRNPKGDLCRKCGKCCRSKVDIEGVIFYTDNVCRHWDEKTGLCTVYGERHKVCRECADLALAIEHGILPVDCPYVEDLEDYVPPVEYWEDPEVEKIIEMLPEDPDARYLPRKRLF